MSYALIATSQWVALLELHLYMAHNLLSRDMITHNIAAEKPKLWSTIFKTEFGQIATR